MPGEIMKTNIFTRFKKKPLITAIQSSIVSSLLLASSHAYAFAEEAQPTKDKFAEEAQPTKDKVERIVVTGSNIPRAGYESTSPVQVFDRESMLGDGAKTMTDVAIKLPINVGSEFQNESGGLVGTSQFNLRGLGLGSTLTLINGRRGGQSAVADGGGNQFFDINQLPMSMIERVEFLTDGASAVYGSQAVAGVANIITRSNFEGFEITLGGQTSPSPDVDKKEIGFAFGSSEDGNTKVNIYGGFSQSNRADRTDFDFINERVLGNGDPTQSKTLSTIGSPGSFRPAITNPETGVIAGTGTFRPDPNCEEAGGVLKAPYCRYSFADQVSVIPEETRIQLFSEFSSTLSEKVRLYGEASYSSNQIKRTQGPFLFKHGLVSTGNRMFVPGSHPLNFFVDDGQGDITYIDPAEWDNEIHQATDLEYRGRPFGAEYNGGNGPGDREIDLDYFRFMSGVDVELSDYWTLNASYMYSAANRDESRPYNYIASSINNRLLDGSWNPFGTHLADPTLVSPKDGVTIAGNSTEIEDSLHTLNTNSSKAIQEVLELKITGELGEMAGGIIGMAAGFQHRQETYDYRPDPLDVSGLGNMLDAPINGEQQTDAVYVEAILPILETVEIQAALRYEDYGDVDTVDPKISMRWQATDNYSMRGSWGTSFQAPSVRQKSISRQSQIIDDPASISPETGELECVNRGVSSITSVLNKGDDELKPQESESFTLGLVANFDSLDASLDYWSFDYDNLISSDEGAQAIVSNECDNGKPDDPRVVRRPDGTIAEVTSEFINTGSVKTNGFDVAVSYDMPDASWYDSLRITTNATYINTFEVTTVVGSDSFEGAGSRNFGNQFRSMPKLRGNIGLNWKLGIHSVSTQLNYIDSYTNDQPNPDVKIGSWIGTNLQYSISLMDENASFQVGVKNLFDQEPPTLGENVRPGYDSVIHDVLGRTIYASFTYSM
jgi:iron complex outermembrane receptor protein